MLYSLFLVLLKKTKSYRESLTFEALLFFEGGGLMKIIKVTYTPSGLFRGVYTSLSLTVELEDGNIHTPYHYSIQPLIPEEKEILGLTLQELKALNQKKILEYL